MNNDLGAGRELLDLLVDAVCMCHDGVIIAINASGRRLLGGPEVVGQPFSQFLHPDSASIRLETLATSN
ncbi:MAG: hypothetical protein HQL37_08885, partial [Alphaproteobacteria bacterium]|nr:hypothetical protein [Alphaproteobacteria bacterium]